MGRSVTSESEDGGLSADSHLSNDNDDTSESLNGGIVLKKGPWTSAEDAVLVEYVKRHGEGNWNAIQKTSGLSRCGKSCRLRWANHLRPNLKKGSFTSEEERLIIELHAKMGNKWARMAAHLPGRTDNEIKNYWNTRIKRRQRAGLPLYPPELCTPSLAQKQQSVNPRGAYAGDKGWSGISRNDGYRTPNVVLDGLNSLPYTAEFLDISASGSLTNGFGYPQFYSFAPRTVGSQKQYHDLDEPMSDYGGGAANEAPSFDRAYNNNNNVEMNVSQPFDLCFPCDPDHTEKLLPLVVNQDCHLMSNGFFSASKPFPGAEKSELPSIQYQDTCLGVWDTAPEFVDSFVQSPIGRPLPSDCPSPRSSGLLESLLYQANSLSKSGNQFSGKATSSTVSAVYRTDSSALRTCSPEFKGLDSTSQSSNSIGSLFNECTPSHTGGSSLVQKMPVCLVKSEAPDHQSDFYRPDAVLGSYWLGQNASLQKQRDSATDSLPAFLGDDLCPEFKMSDGISSSRWNPTSCAWINMPGVSQMPDHP